MLHFMRKHQKYFFFVITIVIVISFSFFGTYSAISRTDFDDPVVLKDVSGTSVKRSEVEQMALFLGTDNEDKLLLGGGWGPNFLNDGVIRKDLVETGLALPLLKQYAFDLSEDLQQKLAREKQFRPYQHPQAAFISAQTVWTNAAPEIASRLQRLQKVEQAASPEALEARVQLFQAERKLPAHRLRQILRYQEKQFSFIEPDPNLPYLNLGLFGYMTVEDWFSPRFVKLVSAFILNAAAIAEKRGYEVTEEEALADLIRNAEISYRQNINNLSLGVVNSAQYFQEQLRRMGMEQSTAVEIWQKVLLFRRMFENVGSSVVIDPFTVEGVSAYSDQTAVGTLYSLPPSLRFNEFNDLQKFEVYLDSISKRKEGELALPDTFYSVEEVAKTHPELVRQRYLLEIADVTKNRLEGKVSVRDTWEYEAKEESWQKLKKKFPELAQKEGKTPEERMQALEKLDRRTRAKVDAFARESIVDTHPEWVDEALSDAKAEKKVVGISLKGGDLPFAGVKDRAKLIERLNKEDEIAKFTGDNRTYYRIKVLDRSERKEIVPFAAAKQDGTLDEMVKKKVGDKKPEEVFAPILNAIEKQYAEVKQKEKLIPAVAASLRFYPRLQKVKEALEKDPESASSLIRGVDQSDPDKLPPADSLDEQWKMVKEQVKISRSDPSSPFKSEAVFSLKEEAFSKIETPVNGDLKFFHLMDKGVEKDPVAFSRRMFDVQNLLGLEAEHGLMKEVLKEIEKKQAISLKYLDRSSS